MDPFSDLIDPEARLDVVKENLRKKRRGNVVKIFFSPHLSHRFCCRRG